MLPPLLANIPPASRQKLLWSLLAAVAAGQLLAFWMLCSHQVRKAQVRDATLQVQQVAVADCLRYLPRATLSSCAAFVDPNSRADSASVIASARPAMGAATPVSFSFR